MENRESLYDPFHRAEAKRKSNAMGWALILAPDGRNDPGRITILGWWLMAIIRIRGWNWWWRKNLIFRYWNTGR